MPVMAAAAAMVKGSLGGRGRGLLKGPSLLLPLLLLPPPLAGSESYGPWPLSPSRYCPRACTELCGALGAQGPVAEEEEAVAEAVAAGGALLLRLPLEASLAARKRRRRRRERRGTATPCSPRHQTLQQHQAA
jgi:hypothetical protein